MMVVDVAVVNPRTGDMATKRRGDEKTMATKRQWRRKGMAAKKSRARTSPA